MSDPQPLRLKPRPRRAAPLQPDKPFGGDAAQQPPEARTEALEEAAATRQRDQAKAALENTRNGYR